MSNPIASETEPESLPERCPDCGSPWKHYPYILAGLPHTYCTGPWHQKPTSDPSGKGAESFIECEQRPDFGSGLESWLIHHRHAAIQIVHGPREKADAYIAILQTVLDDYATSLRQQLSKLVAQSVAGFEAEKKDCLKALGALAAAKFCTPAEGYGSNSSWAIADLCRALSEAQGKVSQLEADILAHQCRVADFSSQVSVLTKERGELKVAFATQNDLENEGFREAIRSGLIVETINENEALKARLSAVSEVVRTAKPFVELMNLMDKVERAANKSDAANFYSINRVGITYGNFRELRTALTNYEKA